jgi:peptidyl-tRNA hydrolase
MVEEKDGKFNFVLDKFSLEKSNFIEKIIDNSLNAIEILI